MVGDFEIAGLHVKPGTSAKGWLEVARSPLGTPMGIPLVVYHGVKEGPVVVVDAATHGEEHEGILAIHRLMRELDPAKMRGTLVLIPILHGAAFEAGTRGNPSEIHYYDLNRIYPGEPGGSITQRLAHTYFNQVVRHGTAHLSLHGGGAPFYLHGFVIAHGVKGGAYLDLVRAFGWTRVADAPDPATNPYPGVISDKCHELGILHITAEVGGAGYQTPQYVERSVSEHLRGMRNLLVHFGLTDGKLQRPEKIYRIKRTLLRAHNGGVIELAKDIDIDAPIQEGQVLLRIYGPMGDLVEECKTPWTGRILGLPSSSLAYPGRIVAAVYDYVAEI